MEPSRIYWDQIQETRGAEIHGEGRWKTGKLRGWYWPYWPEAVPNFHLKQQLYENDCAAHDKLYIRNQKDILADEEPFFFVCILCLGDESKRLIDCMKRMVISKEKPHGAGLGRHMTTHHNMKSDGRGNVIPCISSTNTNSNKRLARTGKTKRDDSDYEEETDQDDDQLDGDEVEVVAASAADGTSVTVSTNPTAKKKKKMDKFFDASVVYKTELQAKLAEFHDLQLEFANNNNVSIRALTSHDCPEFNKVLLFYHHNYKVMKHAKDYELCVRRYRAGTILNNKFEFLLGSVANQVADIRGYYIDISDKRQGFITVMFDGWDSKKKDLLGVTVSCYNPVTQEPLRVALGLVPTKSKKSADVATEVLAVLEGRH